MKPHQGIYLSAFILMFTMSTFSICSAQNQEMYKQIDTTRLFI